METQNLWPDFAIDPIKSPKAILKEQAGYLMSKTNNVLSAEVETGKNKHGSILHDFFIVAPAISNYRYKVLTVMHNVLYYPVTIFWNEIDFVVRDEDEFLRYLRHIFNDPDTIQVVSSLLSQSVDN